jgi:chromate transporter
MIHEEMLARGWLTEDTLLNLIAVSESTPGPIAVNMATFVGSQTGGVLGALAATLGVVLPSFIIILLIAALIRNLLKYKGTQAFLSGVRPCVVGLILATAITLFIGNILGIKSIHTQNGVDLKGLLIFVLLIAIAVFAKKLLHKKPSPILMILISAGLGAVLYSI